MGTHKNISHDRFPKQGRDLGQIVRVVFNYDLRNQLVGKVVRDDMEEPWVTIIALLNGGYVLATECQYSRMPVNE